ncbi:MAG: hypothetical protein N2482_03675, partial [Patescibacteria group bacterium]|nr:hypothetical protein [Patescibacteria group bacterium]
LSAISQENLNRQTIIFQGNLTIDDTNKDIFNGKNLVIMSSSDINISVNSSFLPSGASLAFVSGGSINFSANVTQAKGIYIAQSINTGSSNQGLKIIGNIIAQNNFINNRQLANSARPSVFIVFDQNQYLSLLPYISTTIYEWRQEQ